jgi:hypothetical protein
MLTRPSVLAACFAVSFLAIGARADDWNKKTTITFNQPVDLSGVTLPSGTYVFKVLDLGGIRNIVQVFNAEENQIIATMRAIPHLHITTPEKAHIGFAERRSGAPVAIHDWFFPGFDSGLEFEH